ncbi:MAG: ABC transporter ATP-binding protein [Chloroflexi bacterium]|nr:ABC transporter ATP-binding protein [Chloroflexota bacterium]
MHYLTRQGEVRAVDNVSFTLAQGEALGVVGESGCGKTSIALCLLRVLPDNARILSGRILLNGTDLLQLGDEEMRRWRWQHISMVFQAAMSSLNPVARVGSQIEEAILVHQRGSLQEARERAAHLFGLVGLEEALLRRYPHELSGGMRQRAVIALALSCQPSVVVADEPTTALDVIVQHLVLEELKRVQRDLHTSIMYISHDIGVIAQVSARIAVMYAGKIVEIAPTGVLFEHFRHRYTQALLSCFPRLHGPKLALEPLEGDPPDLVSPPSACRFHPRCHYATEICKTEEPAFEKHGPDQFAACWHPVQESERGRS